jgi:hypothetical protein
MSALLKHGRRIGTLFQFQINVYFNQTVFMKKNFYAMACLVFFLGLFNASCSKDNVKPTSQSIKQGSKTPSSDGNGTSNYTAVIPGAHPDCHNNNPNCPGK